MQREEFVERFESGELPNILKVETLPAHHSDRRGDRHLAVIVSGEKSGGIVDLVWEDQTLENAQRRSGAMFGWVNGGWTTPGNDHSNWGPSLRLICEDRSVLLSAIDTARVFRRIADLLDPNSTE